MATTRIPKDFKEFLQLLNAHEVEYLLVGAYAVNFHGYVRSTGDIDIWVRRNAKNSIRIVDALIAFGFSSNSAKAEAFLDPNRIVQVGFPPFRIDILMNVSGLEFSPCYDARIETELDGIKVNILRLEDLKINKLASGRLKDLSDLEHLP
jgi:predicted nucleotidyltransferase